MIYYGRWRAIDKIDIVRWPVRDKFIKPLQHLNRAKIIHQLIQEKRSCFTNKSITPLMRHKLWVGICNYLSAIIVLDSVVESSRCQAWL